MKKLYNYKLGDKVNIHFIDEFGDTVKAGGILVPTYPHDVGSVNYRYGINVGETVINYDKIININESEIVNYEE